MGLVDDLNTSWALKRYDYLFTLQGTHILMATGKVRREWQRDDPDIIAFSHGNTVVLKNRHSLKMSILRHELRHIRQSRAMGGDLLFKPAVMLSGAWSFITRGDSYDNFFERQALLAETEDEY